MIKNTAYGQESDGRCYAQTCCGEEHKGQACECKSLGENLTIEAAKEIAEQKAKELNVPVDRW